MLIFICAWLIQLNLFVDAFVLKSLDQRDDFPGISPSPNNNLTNFTPPRPQVLHVPSSGVDLLLNKFYDALPISEGLLLLNIAVDDVNKLVASRGANTPIEDHIYFLQRGEYQVNLHEERGTRYLLTYQIVSDILTALRTFYFDKSDGRIWEVDYHIIFRRGLITGGLGDGGIFGPDEPKTLVGLNSTISS